MRMIRELVQRYYRHDVGRSSAALTYYLIFAAFPLLVFFSTLLGAMELDPESVLHLFDQLLPAEVEEIVRGYLIYVRENQSTRLLWFSLVFSIWFPRRATSCLLRSLQRAFGAAGGEKNIILEQLRILLFTVWMLATVAASTVLVTVGRRALVWLAKFIELPLWLAEVWNGLRFVLLALLLLASLAILYMLAQGRRRPLRDVAPGVVSSLAAWLILSAAFSYYVENFATYSQLYGSIATAVVTLLWLYMSAVVVIMGAELNAVILERRRKKETEERTEDIQPPVIEEERER